MAQNININKYDYIMFVDASGDDGMKFEKDSSLCFTTACFITDFKDISHNTDVLNRIKTISGRKTTDELKFSGFRRHPKYKEALKELITIKGNFSLHTAFKQKLTEDEHFSNPKSKKLSAFAHVFPITTIMESSMFEGKHVLICIDRMKELEMKTVELVLNYLAPTRRKMHCTYDIVFKDSKAVGFELIQMADLAAGLGRRFFEHTITDPSAISFIRICVQCLLAVKAKRLKHSCKTHGITQKTRKQLLNSDFKYITQNLLESDSSALRIAIGFFPPDINKNYYFLVCDK